MVSRKAAQYRFVMADHYGRGSTHALVGDGAYLVPDDEGRIGGREMYR